MRKTKQNKTKQCSHGDLYENGNNSTGKNSSVLQLKKGETNSDISIKWNTTHL